MINEATHAPVRAPLFTAESLNAKIPDNAVAAA